MPASAVGDARVINDPPDEIRLIEMADSLDARSADLGQAMRQFEGWMSELLRTLVARRLPRPPCLDETHALTREVDAVNALVSASVATWEQQWCLLRPAHALAEVFEDKVMLLVFGKFNAGKSSLCNALADRFAAHGREVHCFRLEHGRVVETPGPLREGATETTSALQGVCLGKGLVLVDTPGLHSATFEHAALTRRFTDSADGMLWLSSSTSPGQVQELEELARELNRNKPLLPVITRSDFFEEDEVDGEIVKRLRNKTPANRLLQEADVQARACGKLAQIGVSAGLLKQPVSISAHTMRAHDQTDDALRESGFARLYAAILDLIEPALAYKRRKPVEVVLHHLEETVAGSIESVLRPALSTQRLHLTHERDRLRLLQPRIASVVWRDVASEIPVLLELHDGAGDVVATCHQLASLVRERLDRELQVQLIGHERDGHGDEEQPPLELMRHVGLEVEPPGEAWMSPAAGAPRLMRQAANFQQLHDGLQKFVHMQIVHRMDVVFKQVFEALDELVACNSEFERMLNLQVESLLALKRRWRDTPAG